MNWTGYVVRGAVFAIVFTLIGTIVLSMPMPRVLVMGIVASIIWVILGGAMGLFKKRGDT